MAADNRAAAQTDYTIAFDGGSRGNPGQGYGSYALTSNHDGAQRLERLAFPGRLTSNEAEYETLLAALADLLRSISESGAQPADCTLEIRGDSALVIQQVQGVWQVRNERMKVLHSRARDALKQFRRVTLVHHPRLESVRLFGH